MVSKYNINNIDLLNKKKTNPSSTSNTNTNADTNANTNTNTNQDRNRNKSNLTFNSNPNSQSKTNNNTINKSIKVSQTACIGLNLSYDINDWIVVSQMNVFCKVNKNGMELKFKNFDSSKLCSIKLVKSISKTNDTGNSNNSSNTINSNVKDGFIIIVYNSIIVFKYPLAMLSGVIKKFINEGKMSFVFKFEPSNNFNIGSSNNPDSHCIFIYKSTLQILENFDKTLNAYMTNKLDFKNNNNQSTSNINNNSNNINTNNTSTQSLVSLKQTKINSLFNKTKSISLMPSNLATNTSIKSNPPIKQNKLNIMMKIIYKYPAILQHILQYTPLKTLNNIPLINKHFKRVFEKSITKIEFFKDTPQNMFHKILLKYNTIQKLSFNYSKNLNITNIRKFNFKLNCIKEINLSLIKNLSVDGLISLLKRVNNKTLEKITIEQNLFSSEIFDFLSYSNFRVLKSVELTDIEMKAVFRNCNAVRKSELLRNYLNNVLLSSCVVRDVKLIIYLLEIRKKFRLVKEIMVNVLNFSYFSNCYVSNSSVSGINEKSNDDCKISDDNNENIIDTEESINNDLNVSLAIKNDSSNDNNDDEDNTYKYLAFKFLNKNLNIDFSLLTILEINMLVIENSESIKILQTAVNLKQLAIREIVIFGFTDKKHQEQITELNMPQNTSTIEIKKDNPYLLLQRTYTTILKEDNISLEYYNQHMLINNNDNNLFEELIDSFNLILNKFKLLEKIELGSFCNNHIVKILSFMKQLKEIKIYSNEIDDENVFSILNNCNLLTKLDLINSYNISSLPFTSLSKEFIKQMILKELCLTVRNKDFFLIYNCFKSRNDVKITNQLNNNSNM